MNIRTLRAALPVLLLSLAISLAHGAPPPGTTVLPPIDLSPGADLGSPATFALNRSAHKLYVGAQPGYLMTGLKVIDTTNTKVIGGFTFGSYPGASPLQGFAIAVDESAAPEGNKLYVVGWAPNHYVLRIIDGAADKELTGFGTDIVLPISSHTFRVVVNPTNHKVYVSTYEGVVVVIDGVSRKVLTTLYPNAGSFLAVDPVANKVFVLGANGGAIIDSATDTVTAPPKPLLFIPKSAVFNRADQRIYFAGYRRGQRQPDRQGIFVLNGSTGRLAASKTYDKIDRYFQSITIVPGANRVYAGTDFRIFSFDTADLSLDEEFPQPGPELAFDPASPAVLFAAPSFYYSTGPEVRLINRSTGKATHRTLAYVPKKVVVNRSTNRIYVLDSFANDFVVIDGQNHSIIARVPLRPAAFRERDIAVSERLNRVYVTRLTRTVGNEPSFRMVDVYDGMTNRFQRSFEVQNSGMIAIDDTRRHIYFRGFRLTGAWSIVPFLDVYDQDSETFLTSIEVQERSTIFWAARPALAVNAVSGKIYMSTSNEGVSVFDGTTLTLLKDSLDTGSTIPSFIGVNSSTNKIYVMSLDRITVIDGTTDTVIASFGPGGNDNRGDAGLSGIAVDEEADTINVTYKAWNGHNFVSRLLTFDGQENHSLIGAVRVRNPSVGPTFNPVTRQFLVPDVRHGMIKVIQAGDAGP